MRRRKPICEANFLTKKACGALGQCPKVLDKFIFAYKQKYAHRFRYAYFYKNFLIYYSIKSFNFLLLLGCLSFLRAFASICLILSLVTLNSRPTSSRVLALPSSRPNLRRRTFFSLSVSVLRTSFSCSCKRV